jgi:hypothetical protein
VFELACLGVLVMMARNDGACIGGLMMGIGSIALGFTFFSSAISCTHSGYVSVFSFQIGQWAFSK